MCRSFEGDRGSAALLRELGLLLELLAAVLGVAVDMPPELQTEAVSFPSRAAI
jgi:hypothetical protein